MQPNCSHQKGITLLELIIATAIMSVISMISVSAYSGYIETTKVSQAVSQIRALSFLIDDYAQEYGEYPETLRDIGNQNLKDPWGNPYVYLNLKSDNNEHGSEHSNGNNDDNKHGSEHSDGIDDQHDNEDDNEHGEYTNIGAARKDGNLVPINTNYDLCSFGKDGKSKAPLRAKDSHDDIIYANDGSYIGPASEF